MSDDIWVLGATGRSGRGIVGLLRETGHNVVLAGRDPVRLASLASQIGGVDVVSGSFESLLGQIRAAGPAVVVNTIGPFASTSMPVIAACPPGTHYVDIGNELGGVRAVLASHDRAVADGRTVVTGAGFGVLATESVAIRVCAGRPAPAQLRVDAIASLATEEGVIGAALAGSMLDGAPEGGKCVAHGQLARFPVAGARLELVTPTGVRLTTSALPTGDLIAAWRASNADSVISASSIIPSGPVVRAVFPAVSMLLRWSALRRFAIARLARVRIRERAPAMPHSWGHARAEWNDGTVRDSWLQLGDAQRFTETVTAEIARRLLAQVQTGAYTPAALFGPSLATDLGAVFIDEERP